MMSAENQFISATEIIVENAINKLAFDKTIIATIIKKESDSKYLVQYDNIKFYATASREYSTNSQVYVLIPGGNWQSDNKLIQAPVTSENNKIALINPFEEFVKYRSFTNCTPETDINCTFSYVPPIGQPTHVGVRTSFEAKGESEYQLIFRFFNEEQEIFYYKIKSSELIGNPENMTKEFYHDFIFELPAECIVISDLTKITVELSNPKVEADVTELFFAYQKEKVNNGIYYALSKGETYEYQNENAAKHLYIDYVKADQIYNYYNATDESPMPELWWQDISEYEKLTEEERKESIGTFWNKYGVAGYLMEITPKTGRQYDYYKIVIDSVQSETITFAYGSEFKEQYDIDAGATLSIDLEDGNTGNHLVYNEAAKRIIRDTYSLNVSYNLENFKDEEVEAVYWIFPIENSSMLRASVIETRRLDDGTTEEIWKKTIDNDKGIITYEYLKEPISDGLRKMKYECANIYNPTKFNNSIKVIVKFKGGNSGYGIRNFTFGYQNMMGTSFALNLIPDTNAIVADNSDASKGLMRISAQITQNGKIIDDNPNCVWSWITNYKTAEEQIAFPLSAYKSYQVKQLDDKIIIDEDKTVSYGFGKDTSSELTIKYIKDEIPSKIPIIFLRASVSWVPENGISNFALVADYPIVIRASEEYDYISGNTTIHYANYGESQRDSTEPYGLYTKIENGEYQLVPSLTWASISEGETKNLPEFEVKMDREGNTYYSLKPQTYYLYSNTESLFAVYAKKNNEVVWVQPVLIKPYKYNHSEINSWNGELQINKDTNAVMANIMAAGVKEKDNTFTGVIMGSTSIGTGLYGYKEGHSIFKLNTEGELWIGNADDGGNYLSFKDGGLFVQGTISATDGNIAGWLIKENYLVKRTEDGYGIGLSVNEVELGNNSTVFAIGNLDTESTWNTAEFRVNGKGELTATGATITGTINATEGKIGKEKGMVIKGDGLYRQSADNNTLIWPVLQIIPQEIGGGENVPPIVVLSPMDDYTAEKSGQIYIQNGKLYFVKPGGKIGVSSDNVGLNYNILYGIMTDLDEIKRVLRGAGFDFDA